MSDTVVFLYRISNWLYLHGIPLLPKLITYFIRVIFSGWIPASATLGNRIKLGKGGLCIVIHEKSIIGNDCIISHNVTIGGSSKKTRDRLPVIGNRVRIGCGSSILGGVQIGDNVIIGANSLVTIDIPPYSIAGGNPARILKNNIDISEYVDF